jgi:hypothetical protein
MAIYCIKRSNLRTEQNFPIDKHIGRVEALLP